MTSRNTTTSGGPRDAPPRARPHAAESDGGGTRSSPVTAIGHAVVATWPLLIGILLLMLGMGLQGSLLGLRASAEGFNPREIGIVMSSYYLGYLVGSSRAPHLVAAVGHIRVFAALAAVASSAVLVHALLVDPLSWSLVRVVSGFCVAGLFVVAESWLNEGATNETRGALLSLYMIILYGGMGAGQLLLNLDSPTGPTLFALVSILLSIALVPAALSVQGAPAIPQPPSISLREVFEAAPLGVVGSVLAGAASGALLGVGVVYAEQVGLDLGQTSIFMLVAIAGGALLQWPIGTVSDRLDRRLVIAVVAGLAALVCLAGTLGMSTRLLVVLIGALGALSMPIYPLCNAHTNDWIDTDQRVAAGGRLVMASGLGAVTGPIGATIAIDVVGAAGFFWYLAAVHALIAAVAVVRLTQRSAADEQSSYQPFPSRTSVVVATFDPEVWDEAEQPRFDTEEIPAVRIDE